MKITDDLEMQDYPSKKSQNFCNGLYHSKTANVFA